MRILGPVFVLSVALICVPLHAQDAPTSTESRASEQADHEELRALREALTEAVIQADVDKQIEHVHADIITTWQNHQVTRGVDDLREFMKEIDAGGQKVFQGYTVRPTSDDLAILYGGDTAIASGTSVPHYQLLGMEFDLENRWTATLVKDNDNWKIAAYHVSGNILDNPVLTAAKTSTYWAAGISLLVGVLIGAIGGRLMRKKTEPTA